MDNLSILEQAQQQQVSFLQPTLSLYNASLKLAAQYFDLLAADVSQEQTLRQASQRANRKRKRHSHSESKDYQHNVLRIQRIHTQGFPTEQIWQQSRRITDAAAEEVQLFLTDIESENELDSTDDNRTRSKRFDEEGLEIDSSLESDGEPFGEEGIDYVVEGPDDDDDDDDKDGDDVDDDNNTALYGARDPTEDSSVEENDKAPADVTPPSESSEEEEGERASKFVKDKHGLNDGFFSIDDFNKRTQFLERQDEQGEKDMDAASDEESIDWTANPFSGPTKTAAISTDDRNAGQADDEDEDMDDEDGPTFGNADLNAADTDDDNDMDDGDNNGVDLADIGGGFGNTNEVFYADFFAPPASKSESKHTKKKGRKSEVTASRRLDKQSNFDGADEADDEIQRAMNDVHRDLFEDDDALEDDPEDVDELEPGMKDANLSSHERRQLALRAEIRRLEAENVAKKDWSMTGETVAPARPLNALLEEDLDFERAGKPVPIVTAAITESIEELIKRRILDKNFDELIRRRPTDLVTGNETRRGRVQEDLSDAKPTRGLAEEYEQDYLRKTDPNYVDTRSAALKAQHKQIEESWRQISAQLDSLTNWHYKPKPAAANLEIRVDAPTITMEDAQPTAAGGMNGHSLLAPQEVYKTGEEGKRQGEILTIGGTAIGREEMSREDGRRQRRRAKERRKKLESNKPLTKGNETPKKGKQKEVAEQLRKGNVKILDGKSGGSLREQAQPASFNYKL